MSSGEGSNGNKRKAEESAGLSPKKRVHFADALALSGIIQDDQAQEDKNYIKHIATDHEDIPKCKKCNKKLLSIEFNPRRFIMHYEESHPNVKRQPTMSWIFDHFDFVKHKQYLKCKRCDDIVEVSFQGQLVNHILTEHKDEAAKQDDTGESSQGSQDDANRMTETTAKLIQYLYMQDLNNLVGLKPESRTELRQCQDETKRKTWFIEHWGINENNYKEKKIICILCKDRSFTVTLDPYHYKIHLMSCLKEKAQSLNNNKKWLTEYFLFRFNTMWCTNCKKAFTLHIKGDALIRHLKDEHNKEKGEGPFPYDSDKDRLLSLFINHLIDKHEDLKKEQGNEPTQAV